MNWILKRNDNNQMLQLHTQYWWHDEYDWTPLTQSDPVYLLNGSMDIQQGIKKAGRPITLNGDNAWIKRKDINLLQNWAGVPELILTLTHPKGQNFSVIFARPFISEIRHFVRYRPSDQSDDDNYQLNLHFITV